MASTNVPGFDSWAFDVSALMILINENDEQEYRLARRSLCEAFAAAPVSGVQNYLRSYDLLLHHLPSQLTYFSPFGHKSAPLRNMALENMIIQKDLLRDHKFTTIRITPLSSHQMWYMRVRMFAWVAFTWIFLGCSLAGSILSRKITWIGILNTAELTLWSIIIRAIEHFHVQSVDVPKHLISRPNDMDSVFILGRGSSCVLIEGKRSDIKRWTGCGLVYKDNRFLPKRFWQLFTRGGSFLFLCLVFVTIPNGSTMDQLLFILVNVLAQANTLVGRWLHADLLFQQLGSSFQRNSMASRTHVSAEILKHFRDIKDRSWVEKANFLPQTSVWNKWRDQILDGYDGDAKKLYNELLERDNVREEASPRNSEEKS